MTMYTLGLVINDLFHSWRTTTIHRTINMRTRLYILTHASTYIKYLGDNCIQIFHLGRYIVGYTVGNFVLRRRVSGAVKHDFRPYIRRYTTPNEKFEYSYPHSNVLFNYKHRKNALFFAKRERHQRRKTRR